MPAPIYITRSDVTVRKLNERLRVTVGKEVLLDIPLIKVSQVVIFGRATVTGATVVTLLKRGIDLCYLTTHGAYEGRLESALSKNPGLRRAQYQASCDPARGLSLARAIVMGKLANLKAVLLRRGRQRKTAALTAAAARVKAAIKQAQTAATLDEARGCEGDGSAAYFGAWPELITVKGVTFAKRVRRPPTDPVNALLSFGYTLLLKDVLAAVQIVGLDPYIGFLHADRYGRPSLALDLMEEFRPVVVDVMALACFNKKTLTPADFTQRTEDGACRLSDDGRKTFLRQYEERKLAEVTHPVVGQKMTYQQCFEQQARLLARVLEGTAEAYQPLGLPE